MRKTLSIIALCIVCAFCFSSCTFNHMARKFGGSQTVHVEKGKRVIMATWKGDNIWYFVEDMPENYDPQTKKFIESSSVGVLEGCVYFVESR